MADEQPGHGGTSAPADGPRRPGRGPLTTRERWLVAAWAAAPIVLAALVLAPFVATGSASVVEWAAAALVYGGLVALASGFVAHDRLQARQCPRCTARSRRGVAACPACGYDLAERPRWRCPDRHEVYVEPGMCPCGRRLVRVAPPRGIGREVAAVLRAGAWMLAFLVAVGLALQWLAR